LEVARVGNRVSVGVLVSKNKLSELCNDNGGPRLTTLIKANQTVGTDLFFFSLENVNIQTKRILGKYITKTGSWGTAMFSYPQAYYKRYTVHDSEIEVFSRFIKQMMSQGTVFINYQFGFDKWKVYSCLVNYTGLRQFLPATWLVSDWNQVIDLLDANPVIYLKACIGGRGKQVMRVERLKRGDYIYSKYVNGLTRGKVHRSGLVRDLQIFFGREELIAQQAIDLIQVGGRNVDFRAEVQRNGTGYPSLVAIPVRIAKDGSPITTHSVSMSLEKFFQEHPTSVTYDEFLPMAQKFLISIYQAIEICFGRSAEFGIDFGLDRDGKLWFIECNAQSAKVSLFNSYPDAIVTQSFIGLLEYAKCRVAEQKKGAGQV